MTSPSISAVIILYNPNLNVLESALNAIGNQVDKIYLVDNSSTVMPDNFLGKILSNIAEKIQYTFNDANLGVAKAQNIGIKLGLQQGYDYILILDQDSIPESNMVKTLLEDFNYLSENGIKIGVIGPEPINIQTQTAYKPRISKFKPFFQTSPNIMAVPQLISSGSLIHKNVFESVGLMDEFLFIDGVDHEWCWRAKINNYQCALTKNARINHMLGEGDRKIAGIRVAIASPFRLYYQYRNYIYLCAKSHVPVYWKLNNGVKYAIKLIYYPLFVNPKRLYLERIITGIKDGFKTL